MKDLVLDITQLDLPTTVNIHLKLISNPPLEPKYTFGQKNEKQNAKTKAPGPGHYDPDSNTIYTNTPHTAFNKAGRANLNSNEKQNYPGPGEYPIPRTRSVGTKFGKAKRSKLGSNKKNDPGPGLYKIPSIFDNKKKKKGITMSKKLKRKKMSASLGPGAYDPSYTFVKKSSTASK